MSKNVNQRTTKKKKPAEGSRASASVLYKLRLPLMEDDEPLDRRVRLNGQPISPKTLQNFLRALIDQRGPLTQDGISLTVEGRSLILTGTRKSWRALLEAMLEEKKKGRAPKDPAR